MARKFGYHSQVVKDGVAAKHSDLDTPLNDVAHDEALVRIQITWHLSKKWPSGSRKSLQGEPSENLAPADLSIVDKPTYSGNYEWILKH